MPLPTLSIPDYECVLPFGQKVTYRPFLVREEKLLYMAMETQNQKEMIKAVKEIIKNCTNVKNVNTLTTFDIEYLFLKIRGKSVGEELEVNIICPDDNETQVPVTIYLDDIQVQKDENHTNKIKLDDSLMMELKYPSLDQFIKSNFDFNDKNAMDQSFELIASCIDKIYNEDEVWATADCTKKEVKEFLESMNSQQFKEIEAFFESMPKLSHTINVTNPNTKVESEVTLEGLASFFV